MKSSYVPERHVPFTLMIVSLNSLLDTGRHDDITLDEVKAHIEDGTVLRWIQTRSGEDDIGLLSILLDGKTYYGFESFYVTALQSTLDAYGGQARRKWGVENRGLCLLIAWTNEIIQQGHDWLPLGEKAAGMVARSGGLAVDREN